MIMNKVVKVNKKGNEILKGVIIRHFNLQTYAKCNTIEYYSIIDFRFVVKYNIHNVNLIFHKSMVKKREFWQPKDTLKTLKEIIEHIKIVIELELFDESKENFFQQVDLVETIAILRQLEKVDKLEDKRRIRKIEKEKLLESTSI